MILKITIPVLTPGLLPATVSALCVRVVIASAVAARPCPGSQNGASVYAEQHTGLAGEGHGGGARGQDVFQRLHNIAAQQEGRRLEKRRNMCEPGPIYL